MKHSVFALVSGKIITAYEVIDPGTVVVENGRILAVGPQSASCIPEEAEQIDVQGLFVCPGFVELHIHGFKGIMLGKPEASIETVSDVLRVANSLPEAGITSFLPTFIGTDRYENLLHMLAAGRTAMETQNEGAQILGVHLEGPFFSTASKGPYDRYAPAGAQAVKYARKPSVDDLNALEEASGGTLRMMSLSPELDGALGVIRALTQKGIIASGAHSFASYHETILAVQAGMTTVTHMYNGMRRQDHREPGIIEASLVCDQITTQMISDGVHVHAPAMEVVLRCKGKDRVAIMSDNVSYAGVPNGHYIDMYGRELVKTDASLQIVGGSLFGSVMPLNQQVWNLAASTGIPIHDAVYMASVVPARLIGEQARKGSLEPGKDADITVLDQEFNVVTTFCRGTRAFSMK